eukprot:TRINITY_DN4124_c0_g5_i2.p1 TRINITY_DN4124_c0_g5~~TRINITY_DN4124_c0_g5_i2.p1  ORF type:complete len:161 (-),score=28.55 TRINITY_DN4124_c0_g5_i2:289-771(-)
MESSEAIDFKEHIFNHPWEIVMKSLWNKYPNKDLDFVKFSRVIDLQLLDDNSLFIRKLVFCKKYMMMWAYTVEEMKLDVKNRICELKTEIVKKPSYLPNITGVERIIYKAHDGARDRTVYRKLLSSTSSMFVKYLEKFNTSYEKGCQILEEKCHEFMKKK